MPTPVSAARQCLTEEAARTLDDAVAVARRRSHAQTTSLHVVSALLALPSSTLREACARARSCAYSPRLQFRALELSVAASLDRLPTAKTLDEPPISNSLMAAIKRAQANQRRHPETFHLYQQQYNSSVTPSISAVKIELMHFVLSILDDPIVSRVLGEAGFRSSDLKLAVLNPPSISRFSKSRCPPLFLCNLTDSEINKRGFNFPFAGFSGNDNNYIDENSRRIGEVLAKKSTKNPLLIGVCANDALNGFIECVEKGKGGVLPDEISGLSVISIEKEIFEFVNKDGGEEMMGLKFKELNDMVVGCKGVGVVVSYGELKVLVEGGSMDAVKYVVSELRRLVEIHAGKLCLIGAAAGDDTYRKFLARFPSIEKDWDLHLLPITSSKPSSMGGGYPKSSLMGSFVPFGGFFRLPSELENLRSRKVQSAVRCNLCNEKYEQEVSAVLKQGSTIAVADHSTANLPSWLQMAECGTSKIIGAPEAKDDKTVLTARIMGLQKKWSDICHRLHCTASIEISEARSQVPDAQNISLVKENISKPPSSEAGSFSHAEYLVQGTKTQQLDMENICNPTYSKLSFPLDCMSIPSRTSVTTDLRLGTLYAAGEEPCQPICQEYKDRLQCVSEPVSSEKTDENTSNRVAQYSSCYVPQLGEQLDSGDIKHLCRALAEKVCWQNEAIYTISQTISRCKNGERRKHSSSKGSIWLSFLGPDKVGKRKIAAALAEKIYGSRESLVTLDLSLKDGNNCSNSIFDRQDLESYELKFRGKMVVDYVAEQLSKKPHAVVLLEDMDNADILLQNSLSQAVKTGKFPDSHGREISTSNRIFVMTSRVSKVNKDPSSGRESPEFPEERILAARDLQMQIVVGDVTGDSPRTRNSNSNVITGRKQMSVLVSGQKRKLTDKSDLEENKMFQMPKRVHNASRLCLDLNLPLQEMEEDNGSNDNDSCDSDDCSDYSKAWLEDFLDQMDENVAFKPFDFDALSERILKDIRIRFQKIVGDNTSLEIDAEVVVQIVAAAWLSDGKKAVEDWVEQVLCRSFMEAQQKCNFTDKTIMKLVTCEGLLVKEHAPGIRLPGRITVN